jgi:predicted dehydrogenase
MSNENQSRRAFVSNMAGAALSFTIVPRHVLGGPGYTAPSDRVNFAIIGSGGQGTGDTRGAISLGHNLVAVCDVDINRVMERVTGTPANPNANATPASVAAAATQRDAYQKAKQYTDFRQMLEKERNNIDGVLIATHDNNHAVIAAAAMQMGKAVHVQKPLTITVQEARTLAEIAKRTGVVTQMGNQGHSLEGTKRIKEYLQAGVIGPVKEVHVWTNRPIWPQGVPRPTTEALNPATAEPTVRAAAASRPGGPGGGLAGAPATAPRVPQNSFAVNLRNLQQPLAAAMAVGNSAPPPGLDWDLWIGPAQMVQYHPIYHPFNWRGWVDWGAGALGDMGAHLIDQPFWGLDLGLPTSIEATSSPYGMDVDATPATFPQSMTVHYEFAARGSNPAVKMTWYDGGLMPPRPDSLPNDIVLDRSGGGYFVGTKGILMYDTYGNNPRFYPESLKEAGDRVPVTIERVPVPATGGAQHMSAYMNAIMGKGKPSSDFAYATRLTETMLLGLVALQSGQGRKLLYDGANMRFTNVPEANQLLTRTFRNGYSL